MNVLSRINLEENRVKILKILAEKQLSPQQQEFVLAYLKNHCLHSFGRFQKKSSKFHWVFKHFCFIFFWIRLRYLKTQNDIRMLPLPNFVVLTDGKLNEISLQHVKSLDLHGCTSLTNEVNNTTITTNNDMFRL